MTDHLGDSRVLSIEDEPFLLLARGLEYAIARIAPEGPPYEYWPDAFVVHIGRVWHDG